jgi:hypothetical protein
MVWYAGAEQSVDSIDLKPFSGMLTSIAVQTRNDPADHRWLPRPRKVLPATMSG